MFGLFHVEHSGRARARGERHSVPARRAVHAARGERRRGSGGRARWRPFGETGARGGVSYSQWGVNNGNSGREGWGQLFTMGCEQWEQVGRKGRGLARGVARGGVRSAGASACGSPRLHAKAKKQRIPAPKASSAAARRPVREGGNIPQGGGASRARPVSYTHLRAHET